MTSLSLASRGVGELGLLLLRELWLEAGSSEQKQARVDSTFAKVL